MAAGYIVNACSLAFFDQFLKEEPADILDHLAEQYPEVLVTSRQP